MREALDVEEPDYPREAAMAEEVGTVRISVLVGPRRAVRNK